MTNGLTSRVAGRAVDTDRFRLRAVVEKLAQHGELVYHNQAIDMIDVAGVLDTEERAVCFRAAGQDRQQLVGNVLANRRRLALALDIPVDDFMTDLRRRIRNPIAPVVIDSDQAPVHQVVLRGEEVDLSRLPIHLQHTMDAAPYISAALDFSTETGTGRINVGCRRIMPMGRAIAAIDMNSPSDIRAIYMKAVEQKRPMPVAFVVGSHPADAIGSQILLPQGDEVALIGGIRMAPVPLVRCKTIDQLVPADAELVLEGVLDPAGYVEVEGPYGEYLGYYGKVKRNPLFRVTAITMRRDALFQTFTIGGYRLAKTDTAQLVALRTEAAVWTALEATIREPVAVYCSPASGGMFNARFSMRPRYAGEARNALAAVLSSPADVKHAFVVDSDIDVFSDDQFEWALATRFQVDRDLLVMNGMRAYPLDPSLVGATRGSKAGFDLTIPYEARTAPEFSVPDTPRLGPGPRLATVEQALADGPKVYLDIMTALGTKDGREILRAFDKLHGDGRLKRLDDGRYSLVTAP